jgi:hypothetical protein
MSVPSGSLMGVVQRPISTALGVRQKGQQVHATLLLARPIWTRTIRIGYLEHLPRDAVCEADRIAYTR